MNFGIILIEVKFRNEIQNNSKYHKSFESFQLNRSIAVRIERAHEFNQRLCRRALQENLRVVIADDLHQLCDIRRVYVVFAGIIVFLLVCFSVDDCVARCKCWGF